MILLLKEESKFTTATSFARSDLDAIHVCDGNVDGQGVADSSAPALTLEHR